MIQLALATYKSVGGWYTAEDSAAYFTPGRIFLTHFSRPLPIEKSFSGEAKQVLYSAEGWKIFAKVYPFVVARKNPNYVIVLPLRTFGGRWEEKRGDAKEDRYNVFEAKDGWDEARLERKEFPIVLENSREDVDSRSGILDFTDLNTLMTTLPIRNLGRIDEKALPLLEECFRRALRVPLETKDLQVCFHFV